MPADFDLKERVRAAVDIVDVIGATLELHPAGRNMACRCPWHNDKRPSLTVNRERQTWKCWPCDIGGDVFSFVMKRDGVDFPTAMKTLAELAGIPVEEYTRGKKTTPGSPDDKATLLAATKLVADAYFQQLDNPKTDDAKIARDYLEQRGVDEENRKRFQIGFAPDSWSFAIDLLDKNKLNAKIAHAAGVAFQKRSGDGYVDAFRGRLMFPIHDLQNRVISMGGRVIPKIAERHGDHAGGKYINGPETKLFRKSFNLYGLQLAREPIRKGGEALVMEGYTDVVAARQAGIEPVVAVLGTALTEPHIKVLNRFAQRVVLVLDGDAAGQRRADEVLELFVKADVDLRVLTLPDGSDPADFIADHGREKFETIVSGAPDALDHKLSRLTEGIDVTRDTHAVMKAIETMVGVISKAPRINGLKVDQLMMRMARTFELPIERLNETLERTRRTVSKPKPKFTPQKTASTSFDPNLALSQAGEYDDYDSGAPFASQQTNTAGNNQASGQRSTPASLRPIEGVDREMFELLIESPDLAATAVESIDPNWLETNAAKMLLSAYQDLDLAGRELTADNVLLLIENETLKSQVVTLQDRVQAREGKLSISVEERYAGVIARYAKRATDAEKSSVIAKLQTAALPEDEEAALLQQLFDAEKARHRPNSK
ncbi:DNA primase [Planctomycetes bacterium K23_9]|uniref:DNA primase n=1 Tax=Stieleria marina TaxID=1930275 RepID=A0A517NRU8_9BACT|nr:DNA primase [Planctomycetes bacterium K23_9]